MTESQSKQNGEAGKLEDPDELEAHGYELLARAARLRAERKTAGADEWIALEAAAKIANSTVRALRDAGRRGEVELGRGVVRRAQLDAWLSTKPARKTPAVTAAPEAGAKRAVERAARRFR